MAAIRITSRDVAGMVGHWLGCRPNGYLGSGYGSDVKSLLQTPMSAGLADGLIAKCRQDVPLLLTAPPDMVNVYAYDEDFDRKVIKFEVGGELLDVDGLQFTGESAALAVVAESNELIDTVSTASASQLHTLIHATMPPEGYW